MTLAKNVDDTEITFVFARCWAPPRCYLRNLFLCLYLNCTIAYTAEHRRDQASLFHRAVAVVVVVVVGPLTGVRWHQTSKTTDVSRLLLFFGASGALSCCFSFFRLSLSLFLFPPLLSLSLSLPFWRVWAGCNYIGLAGRPGRLPLETHTHIHIEY